MAGIGQDTLWQFASMVFGKGKSEPTNREQATFLRTDSDGTQWVRLSGSSNETPVNGRTLASAKAGDVVEWSIEDGKLSIIGNATTPSVGSSYVDNEVKVVTRQVDAIRAEVVETAELVADKASIGQLEAESARISDLEVDTADIDTIRANAAKVQNLTAAQLEADHATIGTLDTTYMHANMANADVAWIQNGTIKDGAIVSAMINDVSANKLTAGTINGSVINVTNLNADNITAGTINGQRIGTGSLSLDKLSENVYTETEVDNIVDGLNDRIDGAIQTYTGTAVPTLNNSPASSWNTTALKDEHVGDVYYVVNSQSQQNGYCYRFTKSGSTYSWQLIKDSDVTAALSRLTTAEGKITTFDSDISTLKTTTGTLTTKTESLETRMSDAEDDILDKVDTTTFNELEDTVEGHSRTITQHTTAISNKADNSTVTAVTNRVSKNEQDISGINTTIGELQETVESKADGTTVTTISNKLNTVSDTVDGHTQTLTSVQTTQTTMQTTLDKTVKSSIQLWYSKANTTAPNKPTSQVTSTSTAGNDWRIVVPAYDSSYPNYYYCWQYEYVDGTYGWSAVVRDIAMGESQATARTADSNATAAGTAATNAQNTANSNIKSSVQLWFTKANATAPSKPTSVVTTSNANTANAWNLVVPVWNSSYPHYFYCYQQQKGDGTYQWTDVVYDRATSEAQQLANTTSTSLTTLQEDYATYKQTTTENVTSIGTRLTTAEGKITTAETNITQNANNIALKVSESDVTGNYIVGKINLDSTTASIAAQHINLQGAVTISDLASDAQNATLNSNMVDDIYQSAQPNLTPFFEHDLKDVYNVTTNPTGYWNGGGGDYISGSSTFATVMENGWVHINRTNSGTSTMNTYIRPFANGRTLDDGDYTFLVEFRNVESMPTTSYMYTQQGTDVQIWGNITYGGFQINNADIAAGNQSYQAYYKPVQLLGVSQHGTTGKKLVHINWLIPAGGTVTCDLRLSVYEGNYTGPWKSYVDTELTARMKTAEAGISNAAKTATSYVTEITGQNGIMVHPSTDQTTGVRITSDVDILRDGHAVLNVGTQGDTSGNTDAGVTIYDGTSSENVVATFTGDGIGLAGDAFHLTSTKTTTSGGDENIVSNIEMKSTNSSYGVRSNIYSDTSISNQAQGLGGYMGLSLAVGDSTFDNIYANPTIYMHATSSSSALTAAADEVDLIAAQGQIRVETNECVLRFSNGSSNTWSTAAGTVIWSSSGWQMAANVTATLSRNVSTCPSGIVLHWQAYASNATQDYDHIYTFIPKQHVTASSGKGVVCQLANGGFGFVGTKYVYVADSGITGHSTNQATGTSNGITYNNGHWVLTQVIAV